MAVESKTDASLKRCKAMLRAKVKLTGKLLIISFLLLLELTAILKRPVEGCALGFVQCVKSGIPNPAAVFLHRVSFN